MQWQEAQGVGDWWCGGEGVEGIETELSPQVPLALLGTHFKAPPGPHGNKIYEVSTNVSQTPDLKPDQDAPELLVWGPGPGVLFGRHLYTGPSW